MKTFEDEVLYSSRVLSLNLMLGSLNLNMTVDRYSYAKLLCGV